jgi:hypothetical protein
VVHAEGRTFDLFLDGKHLGRISWTQAYPVSPGEHVFQAREVSPIFPGEAQFPFTVGAGESLHLAVCISHEGAEAFPGIVVYESADIRVVKIQP